VTDPAEEIARVEERLERSRRALQRRRGRRDELAESRAARVADLERSEARVQLLQDVRAVLQRASEFAREQARVQVEMLVTSMLQFVFGSDIEFHISVEESRGRPEAEFIVSSDYGSGRIETRPEDARGGGVVDVISLALRTAMLQTYRPPLDGPIVLDEPAKHVSDEYISNVAGFLREVSATFDRQVVMVTHNQHLSESADTTFVVGMRDGRSEVVGQSTGSIQLDTGGQRG